jgi:hypothetical protein
VKGTVYGVPRLVNVPQRAHLQPNMSSLIGPAGDIPSGIIQKSKSRAHGTKGVSSGWRGRAVGVPSLVAYRLTHFMDGAINFLDGAVPLETGSRSDVRLQQFTRFTQVGKGMEIVGTLGLCRRSQSKEQKSRQPEYGRGKFFEHTHFSSAFHE